MKRTYICGIMALYRWLDQLATMRWSIYFLVLFSTLDGITSQSIVVSTNGSTIKRGSSFDLTLKSYQIPNGSEFSDLTCGCLRGFDLKPLVYHDAATNKFFVYPQLNVDSPEYVGRITVPADNVMRINGVTFDDNDRIFQCVVHYRTSVSRTATSERVKLQVVDFFGVSINSSAMIYRAENDPGFTVHCNASGVPLPNATWSFNSSPVERKYILDKWNATQQDSLTSLSIPIVTASHGGTYICQGLNVAGTGQSNFTLVIYTKPGNVSVDSACRLRNNSLSICWSSQHDTVHSPAESYVVRLSDGVTIHSNISRCIVVSTAQNATSVAITATNAYGSNAVTQNITTCIDPTPGGGGGGSTSTAGIIAGILGALVVIGLIIGLVLYFKGRKQKVEPAPNGNHVPREQTPPHVP